MIAAGTKVKIVNAPGFFKDLVGQNAVVGKQGEQVIGKSGETQMVTLSAGGGIFLKDSDLEVA